MLWILSTTDIIVPKSDQGHDEGWSLGLYGCHRSWNSSITFQTSHGLERLVQFLSVGTNECTTISLLSLCVPMFFVLAILRHFETKKLGKFWNFLK
jgi:hypothetical protein